MEQAIPPRARTACEDGAVSVAEASRFTGLGRSELYQMMVRNELAYLKHGRRRLIPRRALVDLLASRLAE